MHVLKKCKLMSMMKHDNMSKIKKRQVFLITLFI